MLLKMLYILSTSTTYIIYPVSTVTKTPLIVAAWTYLNLEISESIANWPPQEHDFLCRDLPAAGTS